ncbi:hypothetical protein X975_23501, partial [Stegodyphus mimosarum]
MPVTSKLLEHDSACSSESLCECSVEIKMEKTLEQQYAKFYFKLEKTLSENFALHQSCFVSKIKKSLKAHHLGILKDIEAATRLLKDIPLADFQDTYKEWKSCWNKCLKAGEMYFEEY